MKIDKKNLIIVALVLVILSIGGIYAYNQITMKFYNYGVQDTVTVINNQILNSLTQDGYMVFVFELNNETFRTELYPTNVTKL